MTSHVKTILKGCPFKPLKPFACRLSVVQEGQELLLPIRKNIQPFEQLESSVRKKYSAVQTAGDQPFKINLRPLERLMLSALEGKKMNS